MVGSLIASSTNAQVVDSTGNLLTNSWTGASTPNPSIFGQCCSGGPGVAYDSSTNTLRFSYGQSTASQTFAVNTALAAAGSGIKVVGYNYSWGIYNDLNTAGSTRGTLTGVVTVKGADNSVLQTYNYNYSSLNTGSAFQTVTGTETFGPQYDPTALSNITVSFTGKDKTFWAGYYGPRVRDASISLNYMTDPCATNPAYSPNCPGFSSVKTSANLGQSYAIQTALAHSGLGLTVHGFDYGFDWHTGENCTFQFIFCFSWGPASLGVGATVTNAQGDAIANKYYSFNSQNNSGSITDSIRFPTSLNQLTLGNFSIGGGGDGGSYFSNVWSRMVYSPDPCEKNPLISSSCTKFVSTVLANQKSAQSTASTTTTDSTGTVTTTSPTASGVTAITTPTAMADPTKNEVTNTNVGGVQLTAVGEVQPVSGVPKVVVRPAPADAPKEKEKEKIVVKLPVLPAAPVAPRRVRQQDDGGVSVALAAQAASVETVQTQQKTETQQAQVQAMIQQTAAAPVVVRRVIQSDTTAVESTQQETLVVASASQLRAAGSSSRTRVQQEQFVAPELPKELAAQQDEATARSLSGQGLAVTPLFQGLRPITSVNTDFPQISSSFASNMLSPLRSAMDTRPIEGPATESNQTVKKDVQNNELAGGVDLTKLAIQPRGFNDYMNLTLTDAAFYGTKEVYKDQRVVDNARAQRLLQGASDRMHQEMVNSQYKLGE